MKAFQFTATRRQHITPPWPTQEPECVLADHAAVHHPHALGLAKTSFDGRDDGFHGLQILRVARQGVVGQREAVARDDQRDDHLLAIAAVIARVAAPGQVVLFGQSLEVTAGQVVEQQVVIDAEQALVLLLQIVFDGLLDLAQSVQRAVQAIFGDGAVGNAEQIFQARGSVPVLGEGELAARGAQAIDDLDGHDVGGPDGVFALGHMPGHDGVQAQELPQPAGQPDIAEAAGVGPADLVQTDADDVRIVGQRHVVVVDKQGELPRLALAVVEDERALPAPFLVVIEFTEIRDDVLPRSGLGANAFDEGVVGVLFAVLGPSVAAQKHAVILLTAEHGQEGLGCSRG